MAVLESKYASLVDLGVPLSVSLQLQQLGLQLQQAQWTARHSLGGFSISFFWPALDSSKSKPPRKQKKVKKTKMKSTAVPVSNLCSNQCTETTMKPSNSSSQGISVDHSPIEARHHQPSDSTPTAIVPSTLPSPELRMLPPTSESSHEIPDLTKCLDVVYERRECVTGVSYRTEDGEEGWTPVIKKKRTRSRMSSRSSESGSGESGNEIDVSCSRLVKYEKREGAPGLMIYRRGPATWTPIRSAKKIGPIASRTRSKTTT